MVKVTNDWTPEVEMYDSVEEALATFELTKEEYEKELKSGMEFDFHLEVIPGTE